MLIIKKGGNKFFSIAKNGAKNASIGLASSAFQSKYKPFYTAHRSKYTYRRKYPKFKFKPYELYSSKLKTEVRENNGILKGGRRSTRKI